MEMMIRLLYVSIVVFLVAWAVTAEEITTGNLLPNAGNNPSNYQSVDSSIPNVTTNGFTVEGTIRDWGQELETTGTGSINYTGTLLDIVTNGDTTTQDKLDNGVTLNSTTIVQNCEWTGSAYQCGQHRTGQDSYTTTVKILDKDGNTLAIVNQTRNDDSGYGNNAFKYEDTVTYSGEGSNQFYWEWEGVDEGSFVNMGGPNLLGAKLTMTYDNTVLPEETIEEIMEVIEEFEEWEQIFEQPEIIEEIIEMPLIEEFLPMVILEEEFIEVFETAKELEEEFEEVEILQVFGGPEIVEEPQEEEVSNEPSVAAIEEEFIEEAQPSQNTTMETVREEPKTEKEPTTEVVAESTEDQETVEDTEVKVEVTVQNIEKQIKKTIKSVDKQLAVTNIIAAKVMESKQIDISSYYTQYVDTREIYQNKVYEDFRTLGGKQIYTENKMQQVAMKDPLYVYQERIRQATLKRVILEKELRILQGR